MSVLWRDYGRTNMTNPAPDSRSELLKFKDKVTELLNEYEVGNIGYVGEDMVDETTTDMLVRNHYREDLRQKLGIKDERINLNDIPF